MNLHDLFEMIRAPYEAGDYEAALAILEREGPRVEGYASRITFWKMCMHSMAGRPQVALELFVESVRRGIPIAEGALMSDTDLVDLWRLPGWQETLEANRQLADNQPRMQPSLYIIEPEGKPPFPLVMALHGNFSSPDLELAHWAPADQLGWMAALPFSSQRDDGASGNWNNLQQAGIEIVNHVEDLREKGRIDAHRIVLAGFSMGGLAALYIVLNGLIAVRGLILVNAVVPAELLAGWGRHLERAAARGLRLAVLAGELSQRDMESAARLQTACTGQGLGFQLQRLPGVAHAYPPDFSTRLPGLLAWVEG